MTELHWRDYPQLFCNDKFGIQSIHNGRSEKLQPYMIGHDLEDCTLIARHPEDMTDEEIREWGAYNYSVEFCHDLRQTFCEDVERNLLSTVNLLYLLSIGVYPFPWPKDGSVIDAKTVAV